jgi:hypothetical protein
VLSIARLAAVFRAAVGPHRLGWRSQTAVRLTVSGFTLLMLAFLGSKLVLELVLERAELNEAPLGLLFAALAALILMSGFFSSSETGMMSLNRYRLKHLRKQQHRGASAPASCSSARTA